jgi:hypothetical protein
MIFSNQGPFQMLKSIDLLLVRVRVSVYVSDVIEC